VAGKERGLRWMTLFEGVETVDWVVRKDFAF